MDIFPYCNQELLEIMNKTKFRETIEAMIKHSIEKPPSIEASNFNNGKYKGKTYEEVFNTDLEYTLQAICDDHSIKAPSGFARYVTTRIFIPRTDTKMTTKDLKAMRNYKFAGVAFNKAILEVKSYTAALVLLEDEIYDAYCFVVYVENIMRALYFASRANIFNRVVNDLLG